VAAEADQHTLKRYGCLVFVGLNTMTDAIYEKLNTFAVAGGRLLVFLPQLPQDDDRGGKPRLYTDGDFSDLFGVQITDEEALDVRGVKLLEQSSLPEYRLPVADVDCAPRFSGNSTPAQVKLTTGRAPTGACREPARRRCGDVGEGLSVPGG
jgi:hypothetical protein